MKILKAIHQGDVLFLKVAELPAQIETLQKIEVDPINGEVVLQHGEALGHFHKIVNTSGMQAYLIGEQNSVKEMALLVDQPTTVVHEEHSPVVLEPGFWISRTQRESFKGLVRPVLD